MCTQLCVIFRVQSALSGVFISLIQEVFIATQLCIIFRVQSALSGVYITQPRNELYTSTVPLIAKLKPKLIPQHKLNTIIGKQTTMWGSFQSQIWSETKVPWNKFWVNYFAVLPNPSFFFSLQQISKLETTTYDKDFLLNPPPPFVCFFVRYSAKETILNNM